MDREQSQTLSAGEVANRLGVSPATVRLWATKGLIPFTTTVGGHRRFRLADVQAFSGDRAHRVLLEAGTPWRILVVDDERKSADYLAGALRRWRPAAEVRCAYCGWEAGAALSEFRPHAVVVDLMMPGLDGVAVCRLIRRRLPDTQIIGVTGFRNTDEERAFLGAGAECCLFKPIDLAELQSRLRLPEDAAAGPPAAP